MANAVLDQTTGLGDLEEVVRIMNNLQGISASEGVYISEGSLMLRDKDDALVGAIRVEDDGNSYGFVAGMIR